MAQELDRIMNSEGKIFKQAGDGSFSEFTLRAAIIAWVDKVVAKSKEQDERLDKLEELISCIEFEEDEPIIEEPVIVPEVVEEPVVIVKKRAKRKTRKEKTE